MSRRSIRLDTRAMEIQLKNIAQKAAYEIAQGQIVAIRQRVAQGIGLDDSPMPPYSKMYAAKKGFASPRNLGLTYQMLRSIHARYTTSGMLIAFGDGWAREKAEKNQARAAWFGVSPADRKKLQELVARIKKR